MSSDVGGPAGRASGPPRGWLAGGPRKIAQTALLAPLYVAPLLGGTAHRPYTLILAALCGLGGLFIGADLLGWGRGGTRGGERRRGVPVSWFALAAGVILGVSLLQLVPLPAGLRALLCPATDATLRQVLGPLGGYPARAHAVSVDPSATANEVVRMAGYLCLLLGLPAAFSHRGDSIRLSRAVYLAAGAVAFLGLLAALGVALPAPLGVAGEGTTRARLPAAFVNSNHMAALMAIGAVLVLGEILSGTAPVDERRRLVWLARLGLWGLLNLALLGTLSRAGITTGLLAQGALLIYLLVVTRPALGGRRLSLSRGRLLLVAPVLLPFSVVLLCGALMSEARQELYARFRSTQVQAEFGTPGSKLEAWVQAMPLLRGHLALGMGRGAFENAFQRFNTLGGSTRFVYLENEWLQAPMDLGVPAAVALFACVVLGLRNGVRRLRRVAAREGSGATPRAAALCAVLMVLLHNLVDFNLEVGGVAAAVIVLCAISSLGRGRLTLPPWTLLVLAFLTLGGAVGGSFLLPDHEAEGEALLRRGAEANVPAAEIVAQGTAAVMRHPLDSHLSALVATRLWQEGSPEMVGWVNRALIANPRDVGAQRISAVLLAQRGYRPQAMSALRYVLPQASYPQRQVLYQTAAALAKEPAEVLLALPAEPRLVSEALEALGTAERPRWPLVRTVAELADRLHEKAAPYWLASAALAERDAAAALRHGRRLIAPPAEAGQAAGPAAEEPLPGMLIAGIAGLLTDQGKAEEAEDLCRRALLRGAGTEVKVGLAMARERRGAVGEARALLEAALQASADPALQAMVHEARASLEERQGNAGRAELEHAEAARLRAGGP